MFRRTNRRTWNSWLGGLLLASVALAIGSASTLAQQAEPKRRDSRLKPPEVTYEVKVEPATARPGETVTYTVMVKVAKPWHIYAWAAEQAGEGPRSTQFDFFSTSGLTGDHAWKSNEPPTRKKEPAFPDLEAVEFHEGEVEWSTTLTVPANAKPGKYPLQAQMFFQICNDSACQPPTYTTLPEAVLTVVKDDGAGGGGAASGRFFRPAGLTAFETLALIGLQETPVEAESTSDPATPAPAAIAPATGVIGKETEVEAKMREGLVPFLVFAALNGLLALLMPCVWPMVPITVNFFLKQGQAKGKRPIGLALVYCVSIIGIFTAIGLFFSIAFGAASTNELGNNPWLNLLFGLAFIAMGLSLLGMFEIRLPSSWLNKSSSLESKGGIIGVMFMAVTLTITSFTCTAPLVGQLLFLAAKGSYLYPTLGLLTFASVLALPFFVLALVPSLLQSVPRSGDWMNSVKVVGGLLEIAAAFKFLNTAEVSFRGGKASEAILDTQVVLSVWVITAVVAGIYMLGMFRTDHDQAEIKVGPLRLVGGTMFLALALYLVPALFGTPPRSEIYESIAGIFPQDSLAELDSRVLVAEKVQRGFNESLREFAGAAPGLLAGGGGALPELQEAVEATSTDPKEAIRQKREIMGEVAWGFSYEAALEEAKAKNRPVLIDFTGVNCANCRTMEAKVIPKPEVIDQLKNFVRVRLYTDFVPIGSLSKLDTEYLAEDNLALEQELVNQTTSPLYVVLDPSGAVLAQQAYDTNVSTFVSFLKDGLAKHETSASKVAKK